MAEKHIVIVGGGPGGLTAAMLLSHRGFKVSLFDKNSEIGGRNRGIRADGFIFDTGPTFLLMKGVLDEMFELCGRDSADYLEFMRLEPMYRLLFDDRQIQVYSDPDKMRQELRRVFPDSPADYDRFLAREDKRFRHLYPCITRDYSSLKAFFSLDLLKALPQLAVNHSVFSNLGRYFQEEKLRLIFSFQSKYLGMSPWQCPALFTMLSYLEHRYGIYHVKGGLNRISNAMAKVIEEQGGAIHRNMAVQSLIVEKGRATGVRLADGSEVTADEVIVNADFAYAMTELVEPGVLKRYSRENIGNKEYSCSTFMLYLGLDKRYDIPHHNIVFASDYKGNVDNIFSNKTLSDDFSFYVQNASVSDDSLAPAGQSTLYVLVPVPNNQSGIAWPEQLAAVREQVLDALGDRLGLDDVRDHIVYEKNITPENWQHDENVFFGATFNLSHKFSQMLYWRPHNRFEELERCYLVGGGTHPGSGLPTIYESARISANMICDKYGVEFPAIPNNDWLGPSLS
ncbi:phytoene desaturase family protein [Methylomarinum sp. Ch1-1]|uniref:Phytoene desaturase family protein n=1 Tax=Methylomarinum roseum TaxID=3067653 RepID=A0AAU7NTS6_9GAMM|nr:phytoene desaturase family protein [Methylomarinum sp. Ch1-1]MDP4519597.1 phytoene desaturase family protein [Methylomarinum sp. Ch1-1]